MAMRTHHCAELTAADVGERVELTGWVHRRRDHGGVIFLDLRDHTGIVQVVYDPDGPESFATADRVRNEYVLRATGRVRPRPEGMVNPDLATGEIEVLGATLEILNAAETPPFQLDEYSTAGRGHPAALPVPGPAASGDAGAPPAAGAHHEPCAPLPSRTPATSRSRPLR